MEPTLAEFYKPVGKVPTSRLMMLIAASMLAAFGVAGATVFLEVTGSMKGMFCAFVLPFGVLGLCAGYLARPTRVHQPAQVVIAAVVASLFCVYSYGVLWVWYITDYQGVVLDPLRLARVYDLLVQNLSFQGAYGGAATPVNVPFYYTMHAIPAALTLIVTPIVAVNILKSFPPFCDVCGKWMTSPAYVFTFQAPAGIEGLKESLKLGVLTPLTKLAPPVDAQQPHLQAHVLACPMCSPTTYLELKLITPPNKDSKETQTVRLFPPMVVTGETVDLLRAAAASAAPAPAPPAA